MDSKWCLVQPKTKKKLYGLREAEVELLANAFDELTLKSWFVWCEGWENWVPLCDVEFTEEFQQSKMSPPEAELEKVTPTPNYTGNSIDEELTDSSFSEVEPVADLAVESTEGEYHFRQHKRLKKRFKVLIEKDGQTFETHTIDISVGGALLEDPMPDWIVGYSNMTLIKERLKEQVQLTCSVVDGQPPDGRFRIEISPLKKNEQKDKLKYWLAA